MVEKLSTHVLDGYNLASDPVDGLVHAPKAPACTLSACSLSTWAEGRHTAQFLQDLVCVGFLLDGHCGQSAMEMLFKNNGGAQKC
jgi:hypothetical protein